MSNSHFRPLPKRPNSYDTSGLLEIYFREENRLREKSSFRLILLSLFFSTGFLVIIVKLMLIANTDVQSSYQFSGQILDSESRHDILDRNGNILATNVPVNSLYAHPNKILDIDMVSSTLPLIFPSMTESELRKNFSKNSQLVFLRKSISEEEKEQVLELGEPGLRFGERELRIYPNGSILSHVLGKTRIRDISTSRVILEGVSGLEKKFNHQLRSSDSAGFPLELSIDLAR